ncbi:S8 family serine peptidase [Dokdonella sp.]|uniref:S8 family serine peptidase n=1 Tax=Dokdonella sp. TaxID=2291710 RepID=UPI00261B55FD|nr:S8 family serine peptidase [Dokdonella sp.]
MKRLPVLLPLVLALNAAGAAAAGLAEVDPAVRSAAARNAVADVLIVLADQRRPSLVPLSAEAGSRERRRALVDALRARADAQQADLRAWLDARGIAHRDYWIVNAIQARVTATDLAALASRDGIARIAANPEIALRLPPQPVSPDAVDETTAIEWGVAKIRAPEVWAAGFTGQGVVIGGQDTGYQWDHPALKSHYRGWDGVTADHDRNWHDAIHDPATGSCHEDSPAPCDDHGHGTHTAGTFAGDDGGSNRIGVAPGAKWIGCRNMNYDAGTPARYIECMQWFLAPTDLAGNDPDPDLAPDIISNSWGCDASEGCTTGNELVAAVDTLVDAGIFFAVAAANHGSGCSTIIDEPAIFDASFVVASTDSSDGVSGFSSRGPLAGTALVRPDVTAPGSNVRSSVPGNGYGLNSGTSMATPHVAGAAALLMSINPALKGHPQRVAALLRDTAVRSGITDPSRPGGCGGRTTADWPNYQAGYGRIDVQAAMRAADTIFEDGFDG